MTLAIAAKEARAEQREGSSLTVEFRRLGPKAAAITAHTEAIREPAHTSVCLLILSFSARITLTPPVLSDYIKQEKLEDAQPKPTIHDAVFREYAEALAKGKSQKSKGKHGDDEDSEETKSSKSDPRDDGQGLIGVTRRHLSWNDYSRGDY